MYLTYNIQNILDARNKISLNNISSGAGASGPAGINGVDGIDLTGPMNIDGGWAFSFYAGASSVDAGYYNEIYGGILTGLDGGRP